MTLTTFFQPQQTAENAMTDARVRPPQNNSPSCCPPTQLPGGRATPARADGRFMQPTQTWHKAHCVGLLHANQDIWVKSASSPCGICASSYYLDSYSNPGKPGSRHLEIGHNHSIVRVPARASQRRVNRGPIPIQTATRMALPVTGLGASHASVGAF